MNGETAPGPAIETVLETALETAVFDSVAALGSHAETWNRLVADAGSDIYFTTPWLEVWAAHYADGRPLRLLLMRDGTGQPVAALPFVITRHTLPMPARIASFMGAQHTIPVFRPAIRPGCERAALDAALTTLAEDRVDAVSLTPLSGEDGALVEAARALAADEPGMVLARDDSRTVHSVFDLPDAFPTYIDGLGRNQRQNYRRYHRKLGKAHTLEEQLIEGPGAGAAFERFAELHTRQWQAAGLPGHFGDWPGSSAFNRDLVARFSGPDAPGRVGFHEIRADGALIASRFFFIFGRSAFLRLPARRVTAEFEKLRLGQIAFFRTVEALIGPDGVNRLEGGPGHYGYKLDQGAVQYPLRRLVLAPAARAGRVRALLGWADALDLAYYRGFMVKVAPRLGLARRPLARAWIRTRL